MQYLLLIYSDEKQWERIPETEMRSLLAEYRAFTESITSSGHYRAGEALEPTRAARTVRVRDAKLLATDGPFAETKEQLGGYYVIDVDSLDEALAWAARIPSARLGSIEVRPLVPARVEAPA